MIIFPQCKSLCDNRMRLKLIILMMPTSCYRLFSLPKATATMAKICAGNQKQFHCQLVSWFTTKSPWSWQPKYCQLSLFCLFESWLKFMLNIPLFFVLLWNFVKQIWSNGPGDGQVMFANEKWFLKQFTWINKG